MQPSVYSLCFVLLIVFLSGSDLSYAQNSQENIEYHQPENLEHPINDTRRLWLVGAGHVVFHTSTLLVLDQLWYRDYPRSSFHFFDDSRDWKQMDKLGHVVSAYHLSKLSNYTYRWAGLDNKRAAIWGSISGSVLMTTIELLDGFSAEWGASATDLAANTIGSLTFMVQQMTWQEQRLTWKYSYTDSGITHYRPELLGNNFGEQLIKDYNGLTLWLSFNLNSFAGDRLSIPPWLNIAVGHSAMGLLGSRENPTEINGMPIPSMTRYRQFYISPDIDFARIPIKSHRLHVVLRTLNFLKFPAPALEYNREHGFSFHLVFF